MYCLPPCPVARHEILVMMAVFIIFLQGSIVKLPIEFWIRNHVAKKCVRVTKPDVLFSIHP
jgi:hypothetical protein